MTSVVGIDSSRLLSQFSGANVTPATASLMWSASSNNPNRPKVATYSTRLDGIIVRILSKGSTLNTTAYKIYLGNLSEGIKAIGSKPEYTSDQEIKAIVGYLTYELDDAKNTLSAGGTIFTEISNLIEGTNTTPATTNTSLATPTNVVTNTQTSTTGTPSTPSVSPNWIGSTININQLSVGGAPVIVARNTAGMIAQSVELMVVNTSYQQALNGGWLAANTNTDLDKFSVTIGASSAGEFINLYKLSEPSASPYGPDASINYDLAVKIKSADGVYRSVQFKVQKSAGSNWGTAATT